MAKQIKIENANAEKQHFGWCVSCHFEGARYHIWLDGETLAIKSNNINKPPTLYKNALVKRNEPGFFECRRLDATNATNKPLVDAMLDVFHGGLKEQAELHAHQIEQNRLAVAADEARISRIKEAGPQLFEALREICEFWAYGLAKPDGTNPSVEDKEKVERIALKALHTLHAADPSYVHTLPASGDRPD
jgi:hypothetical protein